jgi:hypothetical protein
LVTRAVVIALLVPGSAAWAQAGADVTAAPPPPPGSDVTATPPPAAPPPVASPEAPPADPQAPAPPAPTRATFLSTSSEAWDVTIDGVAVCSTPCTHAIYPVQFVTLRSQETRPVLLDVGRLPPGDLIVSGKPLENGMYAGGIVATTLGAMAMVVGITFTAVGYGRGREGMATAGLITGGAGTAALVGGIYLMMRAVPMASVDGASPYVSARTVGVAARF